MIHFGNNSDAIIRITFSNKNSAKESSHELPNEVSLEE
jgi:hypothetical protein